MAKCYRCGTSLPDGGISTRVMKGDGGRRKNGYVLMCAACSANTNSSNAVVAIIAFIAMGVLALIFFALGVKS